MLITIFRLKISDRGRDRIWVELGGIKRGMKRHKRAGNCCNKVAKAETGRSTPLNPDKLLKTSLSPNSAFPAFRSKTLEAWQQLYKKTFRKNFVKKTTESMSTILWRQIWNHVNSSRHRLHNMYFSDSINLISLNLKVHFPFLRDVLRCGRLLNTGGDWSGSAITLSTLIELEWRNHHRKQQHRHHHRKQHHN